MLSEVCFEYAQPYSGSGVAANASPFPDLLCQFICALIYDIPCKTDNLRNMSEFKLETMFRLLAQSASQPIRMLCVYLMADDFTTIC